MCCEYISEYEHVLHYFEMENKLQNVLSVVNNNLTKYMQQFQIAFLNIGEDEQMAKPVYKNDSRPDICTNQKYT